jgi:hypothetical protein
MLHSEKQYRANYPAPFGKRDRDLALPLPEYDLAGAFPFREAVQWRAVCRDSPVCKHLLYRRRLRPIAADGPGGLSRDPRSEIVAGSEYRPSWRLNIPGKII